MKIRSIDTVHFGIDIKDYYINSKQTLEKLAHLKQLGQAIRQPQQIELNNTIMTVELSGARFYAYRLTCKDFTLLISEKPSAENPPVKVNFSSSYLWSFGYKQSYYQFIEWFQKAFDLQVTGTRISRLDICVDTDEAEFKMTDINGIVTYSKTKTMHFQNYADDINYSGRDFTGITIGRGNTILCRIYDKTKEIAKSGKEWFKEIWQKNNWNQEKPVWRVEFQLRRKVLKEFLLESVEDTFLELDGLWKYLTTQWLEIRKPIKEVQPSRWQLKAKWKAIQAAVEYEAPALIRLKIKKGNLEKLKAQAGGLLISIGAAESIEDIKGTVESLHDYMIDKLKKKKKKFEVEVKNRQKQYMEGRSLCLPVNGWNYGSMSMQPIV